MTREFKTYVFVFGLIFLFSIFSLLYVNGMNNQQDEFRVGMEVNYAPFNWSQKYDNNGAVEVSNSSGEYANGYDVQMAKK